MRNGILYDILKIMKINGDTLQDYEKLTVLIFGEIKISTTIEYDTFKDIAVGPHSEMQVVMARGIASNWKQPIFIDFDTKMTKSILFDIIDQLNNIGFKVICCVSDCDDENLGLWKELEITYENPIFVIPKGQRIVYVPDSSHLMKLTRNWLLDRGFTLDGAEITKEPLEALISNVKSEVSVCYKLTKKHITCDGSQRQNIKLATQLLSHTTAIALQHYRPISNIKLLNDTAHFIKLINNWFELANVAHKDDRSSPFKSPYGTFLIEQDIFLNEVYDVINSMRCKGESSLQIFQKGILMYINGIKQLVQILRENEIKYLLTIKLNKDLLANLFCQLRSRDDFNDYPSPLNVMYRLRMIILGENAGIVSNNLNTIDNNQEEYIVAKSLKLANINLSDDHTDINNDESDTDTASENELQETNKNNNNKSEKSIDVIEYLAGWVAKKFIITIPEVGCSTGCNEIKSAYDHKYIMPPWINHLSKARIISPSENFKKIIFRADRLFDKFTKRQLPKKPNVVNKLTNKIFSRLAIDKKFKSAIKAFTKQRIIIRMKYNNYHKNYLKKQHNIKIKFDKLRKLMI